MVSRSVDQLQDISPENQEDSRYEETKHLGLVNDNFRAQSLKFSMDHLNEEVSKPCWRKKIDASPFDLSYLFSLIAPELLVGRN